MIYFVTSIAAIAGLLFGYDEGVIAIALPLLTKEYPMTPAVSGFMTAAVPLGASSAPASPAGSPINSVAVGCSWSPQRCSPSRRWWRRP